jgi:hypothetical protein
MIDDFRVTNSFGVQLRGGRLRNLDQSSIINLQSFSLCLRVSVVNRNAS